eukprot:830911_1
MPFEDSNIESILQDSGAFATNNTSVPPQTGHSTLAYNNSAHDDRSATSYNSAENQVHSTRAILPLLPPQLIQSKLTHPSCDRNHSPRSENSDENRGSMMRATPPHLLPPPTHPNITPPFCDRNHNSRLNNSDVNRGHSHTRSAILPPLHVPGYFNRHPSA